MLTLRRQLVQPVALYVLLTMHSRDHPRYSELGREMDSGHRQYRQRVKQVCFLLSLECISWVVALPLTRAK